MVRIVERSSFLSGGIIDLSPGALSALGLEERAPVCLEVVSYGSQKPGYQKPSMLKGLLEAFAPKRHHYAAAANVAPARSAKAKSGTRSAKVHHRRRHYAGARHGGRKRYAKLNRRNRSMRRRQGAVRLSRR